MRKFLYLFLVIGLVGCNDITGLSSDVEGTYQLYAIDGQRLPATLETTYGYDVFRDGILRISSNGTFVETVEVEEVRPEGTDYVIDEERGSYDVIRRGEMILYYDSGGSIEAQYDSRSITLFVDLGFGDYFTIEYRR